VQSNVSNNSRLKIRRALITVSDKTGIAELARALHESGTEIVATGKTAQVIKDAGIPITNIEKVSGSPEAFQGRMKTLSFPVCSGILYRRGDASDEADLKKLAIPAIDCVVVNFYPFEQAVLKPGISRKDLIEEVDIGGPTMVRAAAKNAPDVLVLTSPSQYPRTRHESKTRASLRRESSSERAS
jgi:phosphoribosylaminoimidazolecarboxamide formyltransferase/IMP cyclohydrolase